MHLTQKKHLPKRSCYFAGYFAACLSGALFLRCPATALKHRMETSPLTRRSSTLTQPTAPKMTICHCLIL